MSSDRQIFTLGDVADVSWGDTSTTKKSYSSSGFDAYSASGRDGLLPYFDYDRTGVVISAIGAECGKTWLAKGKWSCIKNTIRMWSTSPLLDTEYLYWISLRQNFFPIRGSAQPFISQGDARGIEIECPPIHEQKAIAHILGTLDDKIELNRKTNETLEAMAKALFKSWFVDFDPVRAKAEGRPTGLPAEISDLFPDSFEDSELGEIPIGWEVGGLEEFLVLQRGFDLPAPQRIKGAYPVVAASGVSGTHNESMASAPGVVTGRSGVLGKVFYIQTDFFPLNTTLWAKEFRLATPIYGYFLLSGIDFAVFNAGSAVPTLNRNHLGSLRFTLPPKALVASFTDVAADLMKRKEGIAAEASNLTATRDALLPKLISGEIRIPDAERMLEEVGV